MGRNYYGSETSALFSDNKSLEDNSVDLFKETSNKSSSNINSSIVTNLLTDNHSSDGDLLDNRERDRSFNNILTYINESPMEKVNKTNKSEGADIYGIKVANILIEQLCSELDFLRGEISFLRKDNEKKTDIIKQFTTFHACSNPIYVKHDEYKKNNDGVPDRNLINTSNELSDHTHSNPNNLQVGSNTHEKFRQQKTKRHRRRSMNSHRNIVTPNTISLQNRFDALRENTVAAEYNNNGVDDGECFVTSGNPEPIYTNRETRRPPNVIQQHPENNLIKIPPKRMKVVPGKYTYAEVTTYGRRVCVFGDSIPQRLNMTTFNENLKQGYVYKRVFPGGTVKQLKHYITETIDNDDLDAIIINVGLNSLQTKNDQEIVQGILDMVHLCHEGGIKDVLVSGLTYKEGYEANIRNINGLLKNNERLVGFTFIDNCNIDIYRHLWTDDLHLNNDGLDVLLVNFVNALNMLP